MRLCMFHCTHTLIGWHKVNSAHCHIVNLFSFPPQHFLFCATRSTDKTDDSVTNPTSHTPKSGSFDDMRTAWLLSHGYCGMPVNLWHRQLASAASSCTAWSPSSRLSVTHPWWAEWRVSSWTLVRLLRNSVESGTITLSLVYFYFF